MPDPNKTIIIGHSKDPKYELDTKEKMQHYIQVSLMQEEQGRYRCNVKKHPDAKRILSSWDGTIYACFWTDRTLAYIPGDKFYSTIFNITNVEVLPRPVPLKNLKELGDVEGLERDGAKISPELYQQFRTLAGLKSEGEAFLLQVEATDHSLPPNMTETERDAVVKTRIGQSWFRDQLFSLYSSCVLCGLDEPSMLIASHIKPWREASNEEKLDIFNGLLLCANHDKLFDKGLITIDENGNLIIQDYVKELTRTILDNVRLRYELSNETKQYMKFQRMKFFNIG